MEEPSHVDMLRWGHPSSHCEEARVLRDERVLRTDLEHHQIVIAESDLRSRPRGHGVYKGRIGHPCLTGIFEMVFHTSPFVPNKETMESSEEESEDNKDDNSNFSGLDQVASDVVDKGGVELVTERKSILIRNGQKSRIKRETSEGIINVLF